jgi:hypothetical protein
MNKLITCKAWDLLGEHYEATLTHDIRIAGGRALYDEARNTPGGKILLVRIEAVAGKGLKVKVVRRTVEADALVELVPHPQPASAPARIRQVSAVVEVASLPVTSDDPSGLADEFAAIEIEMVRSGKFIMVEIEGKTTLFPLRPMVIDCADDGYSFVSGGIF